MTTAKADIAPLDGAWTSALAYILEFGLCEHHRRSFCENILAQTRMEL